MATVGLPGVIYRSSKTYNHSVGLSCCFRQWRADSHCRFLHGYALEVKFTFRAEHLDKNGWVQDFGGLKPIKAWLELIFDHKTLVALDDPEFNTMKILESHGVIQMVPVVGTGCEAFAEMIFAYITDFFEEQGDNGRVWLEKVEVREHSGNSAEVERQHLS